MKREETIQDTRRSRSPRRRRASCAARRRRPRGRRRERGRLHRAEPRPRPEPGRHPRRLLGPDRARPAGRQGAGGRLPRRIGHLDVAVHAGHRPLRREPRRGAARTAGHAVRLRLALGHRALHQQPARARRQDRCSARSAASTIDGGNQGGNVKLGVNAPARRQGGAARRRLLQPARRLHGRRAARL